jgi:hypothetical protein
MVISLDSNGEWVKGCPKGKEPFISMNDQALDTDVRASGKLLGLSCAGIYEIETAHFETGSTYNNGNGLKAMTAGDAGKLDVMSGYNEDVDIIGKVTRGVVDVVGYESGVEKDDDGAILVLTFITGWQPARSA